MIPYWFLFAYFTAGSLFNTQSVSNGRNEVRPLLLLGALLITIMIGLRYEVGGDWNSYKFMFSFAGHADLGRILTIGDPGYQLLNWTAQQVGAELWVVNLICGAIFSWGLYQLAKVQPDAWLAILVAVPYLIIVVAMGYSRQAVAIGILMAGLAVVQQGGSVLRFVGFVAVAALFHRSAVVVLPLVIFAGERNRLLNVIGGLAAFAWLFDMLLADSVDQFVTVYIEAEYSSQGALIRVLMNLIPAAIFLARSRLLGLDDHDRQVWRHFSYAAFACLVLLLVLPSSTAVDRIALYIVPLQIVVLSRLGALSRIQPFGRLMVIGYSAAILYVWLNYAAHADEWLPYRFFPL